MISTTPFIQWNFIDSPHFKFWSAACTSSDNNGYYDVDFGLISQLHSLLLFTCSIHKLFGLNFDMILKLVRDTTEN